MKTGNGNKNNPTKTNSDMSLSMSSERRPSTVVGFKTDTMIAPWSKWANRFVIAAIIQGALAAGATAFLLYDSQYGTPGAAKIVAGGGAGNWLTVGYLGFIIFGPLAAAVTSLFYQHLESNLRAPYTGISNVFAWLHLVLMNVGVTGATWLMWIGGWRAVNFISTTGASAFCKANATDPSCSVHVQVLGPLVTPIGAFALVALIGAFAGGLGYVAAWRRAPRQ
ncbi:MAG TPA: hypothetical protein VE955_06095 [Candidatus Dormibacteraeota bacterium]|jgi:hypothetical protein|nr:hypothetical protein [Candidatus Dormibacteraeota bacterium]